MSSSSYHITSLLEKMGDSDKDFRFMALTDLMCELQKESLTLDPDTEEKIADRLLMLLGDKNGEVQNLAVKCLGPLVSKVKGNRVEHIVDVLGNNMLSNNEQLRDISTMGLKMVISELHCSSLAAPVSRRICTKLTTALVYPKLEVQIQLENLDIMADVLHKFGGLVQSQHDKIQAALLPLLKSARVAVRKRASVAIGYLVTTVSTQLFEELIAHVMEELLTPDKYVQSYITCINVISRHAGHRFGDKLKVIVPKVAEFAYSAGENDELREAAIQVLESCILWCPGEMQEYTGQVTSMALQFICYDPNYNYDAEDEDDVYDDEEDEEYSDDEDMSWKVRRACAKCLAAIVQARPELLQDMYVNVSPVLISRFKEREESVRLDIFHTYSCILAQTGASKHAVIPDDEMADESPLALLAAQVDPIVKGLQKQLHDKNSKTRQCCFTLLGELVNVLPGCLAPYTEILLPAVHTSISDKSASSSMRISSLVFLRTLMQHHEPVVFHPHLTVTLNCVIGAIQDNFYKVISEALLVCERLVLVIRPTGEKTEGMEEHSIAIFNATLYRLKAADLDQEVKERAIACMGQLLCNMADLLQPQLSIALPLFLDRLRNEVTRLTCVKALSVIAQSPLNIDLSLILAEAFPLLGTFLRKYNRALKLFTLDLLEKIVLKYSTSLTVTMVNSLIDELPRLVSESDLHLSQLALQLVSCISTTHPQCMEKIPAGVLPAALTLIRSPLLQGSALTAMTSFFCHLVKSGIPSLSFVELVQHLTNPVYNPSPATQPANSSLAVHKQAFYSTSACVASLALNSTDDSCYQSVIKKLLDNLKCEDMANSVKLFALLSLGEIGKFRDLSEQQDLQKVIMCSFHSSSEEVKSAASYALGNISVGNLNLYLPFILREVEANPKRQYLLLHSLKEIITSMSESQDHIQSFKVYVPDIWNLLVRFTECPEEGSRNVVAECLGKLMLIDHESLLPKLQEYIKSSSAFARSTVVTAVKYTITEQPQPIDNMLKLSIGQYLTLLEDEDLNVRRMTLITLNSAAHNKPLLIRDLMEDILPSLYKETKIKLKREVEMGPFKYPVDDALDNRKAAFECMYTLLQSCLDRLNIFQFLDHVEIGLKDVPDIKMLTYLMVLRLIQLCPNAIILKIGAILEPLRETFQSKAKDICPIGQEVEKAHELKSSAMRTVVALGALPEAEKHPVFMEFMKKIRANKETDLLLDQVVKSNQGNNDEGTSSMEF